MRQNKVLSTTVLLGIVSLLGCSFGNLRVLAAPADNWRWVPHNTGLPTGGDIVGSAIDPTNSNIAYVFSRTSGVYKTTDGGGHWTLKVNGLSWWQASSKWGHLNADMLTMDPNNPQVLYAAFSGKVYKTIDGADTWVLKNTGLTVTGGDAIAGVAVDPFDSNHLFAGTIIDNSNGGLFESTNGGTSWTQKAGWNGTTGVGGYSSNDAWPIAFDPVHSGTVYFSSLHGESMQTSDGGVSWVSLPAIEGVTDVNSSALALTIQPGTGTLFASFVNEVTNKAGLWRLPYGGTAWQDIGGLECDGHACEVSSVKFAPSSPSTFYALTSSGRIMHSADDGNTWTEIARYGYRWASLSVSPTDPETLILGSNGDSLYRSIDGGLSVTKISTGLLDSFGAELRPYMTTFVQSKSNPSIVYLLIAQRHGLYRSDDGGYTWTQRSDMNKEDFLYALAVDPTNPDIVMASVGPNRLGRSTDGGRTWTDVATTNETGNFPGFGYVAFAPSDHTVVYAKGISGNSPTHTFQRSADNGVTWADIPFFNGKTTANLNISIDPNDPNTLYTGTDTNSTRAFYKSVDGGQNWTQLSNGLLPADVPPLNISVDPRDGQHLLLSAKNSFYASFDGGNTMVKGVDIKTLDTANQNARQTSYDSVDPAIVYGSAGMGGFVSHDRGSTWAKLPNAGLAGTTAMVMASTGRSGEILGLDGGGTSFVIYENYIPRIDSSTVTLRNTRGGDTWYPGDMIEVTATLRNTGPLQAINPRIRLTMPSGISMVSGSVTRSGMAYVPTLSGQDIILDAPTSASGSDIPFSLVLAIDSAVPLGTSLTLSSAVFSDEDATGISLSPTVLALASVPRPVQSGAVSNEPGVSAETGNLADTGNSVPFILYPLAVLILLGEGIVTLRRILLARTR